MSLGVAGALATQAGALDYFGPPPPDDPSFYRDPPPDADAALRSLYTLPEANLGAFELPNGEHSGKVEQRAGNVLPPSLQSSFNYPTNGYPSPMFGAQPWTQKMLMFEEFGPEKLDPNAEAGTLPLPLPTTGPGPEQDPADVASSGPAGTALEGFLKQPGIFPFPKRESNTTALNPWQSVVEGFLGRALDTPPAEGRPPGEGWAHQRWNEFYPQSYYKTAQAGARVNGGFRDSKQLHQYKYGEFGPGGLYHNTTGLAGFDGTTRGIAIKIHPNMPVQDHKSLWTFDGTLPPKLLMARYGQPILMRHYNALPVDPAANRGFGLHTITTHEHNGHNPAESDGFANAFFFPGQFYDYRWPLQLAGYDSINTNASDPKAAFPCSPGETLWVNDTTPGVKTCQNGKINIRGDWRETMSTHWFHDHMLDFTAQNVYKGNAVMMNYYSGLDRGNEALNDGVNLRLPSGSAMPWGNRDYDVNLVIGDKAWDQTGQLWFNPFNTDGFLGDRVLVNWQYAPYLDVRARRYRFRMLNGSVSRYFTWALVKECAGATTCALPGPAGSNVSYSRVPFHMVANDGNILEYAVPFDGTLDLDRDGDLNDHNAILPTQAIAERYDIVVDFARNGIQPGDKVYFVNIKEHQTGIESKRDVPLGEVLSGEYQAVVTTGTDGKQRWDKGDPAVGKVLELRVQAYTGTDLSMDPSEYEPAKPGKAAGKKMIPLWLDRNNPADQLKLANARHREFHFGRSNGTDLAPWTIKTDGGAGFNADPRRISAAPQLANGPTDAGYSGDGTLEVWTITTGGGWGHPVHVHFEEGIIIKRGGKEPPEWEKWARKDVYRIGPEQDSTSSVELAIHFREFAGTYVEHCHNTQHEDNAMLLRWDIERPGQFQLMPTPMPTWDGVTYTPSVGLPTFRTGLGTALNPVSPPANIETFGAIIRPEVREPAIPLPQMSLKTVPVPKPTDAELAEFVVDKQAAIALGKALFWDTRVGSDNKTACASCHFSAGADKRMKNQVSPGLLRMTKDLASADPDNTFQLMGPNYNFNVSDFPLTKFRAGTTGNNPANRFDVNDVISSQGVLNATFGDITPDTKKGNGTMTETCTYELDPVFHYGAVNTRQVPARNAPSVINAAFNFRLFWDGRANNQFNGGDPFGTRNPNALVWKIDNGAMRQVMVKLPSSALASQASGPPLSEVEMSCSNRTFAHLGKKILGTQILTDQAISATDGVLGAYATANARPLYRDLVAKAFNPAYWMWPTVDVTDADAKKLASMDLKKKLKKPKKLKMTTGQMEANFALFFGLAIQMYEQTLVSDDSRFDQWAAGDTTVMTDSEKRGFDIFMNKGLCQACHVGAEFTGASFRNVTAVRLERMDMRDGRPVTYDSGFYNIGVRPTHEDLGIGGRDPFGKPLSESLFMTEALDKDAAGAQLGNNFETWKYLIPKSAAEVNMAGSFKAPSLRNVELTGPYFHNGGKATLMQVIDHYDRGGDFGVDNIKQLSPAIIQLGLTEQEKIDVVSFLLSLTDDRVRMERAPFDHPSVCVANGHVQSSLTSPTGLNAVDDMMCLDAVGSEGRTTPITPFLELSPYQH
ncbi:cytochrome c peroxidase [Ramlibacter monticola]|uniref:cytochrome c peroxidase n=1 Tax=Ramlibacter monticola TaxID=1926872 RepID=UPI001F1613EA|nr:cytochrome c peroxidase [Ramlibacter monticola]